MAEPITTDRFDFAADKLWREHTSSCGSDPRQAIAAALRETHADGYYNAKQEVIELLRSLVKECDIAMQNGAADAN